MPTRKRKFNTVGSQKKSKSTHSSKRRKLSSTSKISTQTVNKHNKKVTKKKEKKNKNLKYEFQEVRDTEITPYTLSELEHLTVSELKQLLRKQNFPVSGRKSKLIERLTKPKQTINEMKLSYHRMVNNDQNCCVYADRDTPIWWIAKQIQERQTFRSEDYIFIDGRIKYKSNFN
mmetsp:Transcript_22767/g.20006  ORF Transcript_22767/g.20006 Transcript_22767/m.20006 type:complete len:174 (-) Transcript_22767:188-709(-)